MSQWCLVLASAVVLCVVATSVSAQTGAVLRPEHPEIRKLIELGSERSATFAQLIERLEAATLVVYVRFDRCGASVAACTQLVAPQDGRRRLLVVLDRFGRGPSELIALLAHELQHASEIADAPDVVDDPSLRSFYSRIGLRLHDRYETAEALRIGRVIAAELAQSAAR